MGIDKFTIDAINKMLEIAGYKLTYEDLKKDKDWIKKYSMTNKQHDEWEAWFIKTVTKRKICPATSDPQRMFDWYDLDLGLRIKKLKCYGN
jgi:hypothetical protein